MNRTRWTADLIEQVRAKAEAGFSGAQAAADLSVPIGSLMQYAQINGINFRKLSVAARARRVVRSC